MHGLSVLHTPGHTPGSVADCWEDRLFSGKYNKPILYAVGLAMFNQLSGINAIMYYAPRIFEMTGLAKDTCPHN